MLRNILLLIILTGFISLVSAQVEPYPPVPEITGEVQVNETYPPVPTEPEPPLPSDEQQDIIKKLPEKAKTLILELNIKEGKVTKRGTKVVYGIPRGNAVGYGHFNVLVEDDKGDTIEEFGIMDPRIRIVEENGIIFTDDVDFAISVPFHENMRSVSLVNATIKEEMINVDVEEDVVNFCEEIKYEDPQCRNLGGVTASATQPGEKPDFFISIDPKSTDARPGDTVTFKIRVTTKGDFSHPITARLIITGPANMSMEFDLPEILPPYPKEFEQKVTIPEGTVSGRYTGKIVATGGGITKEDSAVARIPYAGSFATLLILLIANRVRRKIERSDLQK